MQDRDEYVDSVAGQIDMFLTVVYVLLFLAIIIALMGIANTLSLSVYERTRELGLLRAVGQSRQQLRAMVRWESVIIAVFGTVGGIMIGLFLGWGLLEVTSASEDIPAPYTVPFGQLLAVLIVGGDRRHPRGLDARAASGQARHPRRHRDRVNKFRGRGVRAGVCERAEAEGARPASGPERPFRAGDRRRRGLRAR